MSDQTIILIILAVAVVLFVWNRLPVGIVALGVAISLWATDVVTLEGALIGFSSPTVVLIAALFVVAEGLDAAGITTWMGQLVVRHSGGSRGRLILLVMAAVAVLSALITPNGAVAALYPMVVVLAVRLGKTPSKLLMPAAFAAHGGALLVLTGSPVTLLVSEAADDAGQGPIGYFEIALVGIPLLLGTMAVAVFLGERLLPVRTPKVFSRDLSKLPQSLREQYIPGDELVRFRLDPGSPLIGEPLARMADDRHPDVHVITVDGLHSTDGSDQVLREGTEVMVRGTREDLGTFALEFGFSEVVGTGSGTVETGLINRDYGVAEVIITPRSDYIGDLVYPGMVTESGSLVVLAVQRHGTDLGVTETTLKAGDSLLLQGRWDALDEHIVDPNVVVVDTPDSIRRQTVPLGPKAVPALVVLAAMVVLLATGILSLIHI